MPGIEDSGIQLPAGWGPKLPPVGSSPSPSCAPCPYYSTAAAGSGMCMPCPGNTFWRNAVSPGTCSTCPQPKTTCRAEATLAINTKNWAGTLFPAGCCYAACITGNKICDNAPNFPLCEYRPKLSKECAALTQEYNRAALAACACSCPRDSHHAVASGIDCRRPWPAVQHSSGYMQCVPSRHFCRHPQHVPHVRGLPVQRVHFHHCRQRGLHAVPGWEVSIRRPAIHVHRMCKGAV